MAKRYHAIDAIRGFCLINILINHLTVGVLHALSPSNLGFSDSAELFVFLAGVSTYLAYGKLSFKPAFAQLWSRAAKLYRYNLVVILAALISLLALDKLADRPLLDDLFLRAVTATDKLTVLWHIATLRQSVGYSMVLRLYVLMMLVAPGLLWLAARRWWLCLPPAILVWLLAGHFGLAARDSLTGVRLTMTLAPWLLIFTCGLALGAGMAQGARMPRSPFLLGASLALIAGYLVLLQVLPLWPEGQAWAASRDEHFWLGASKIHESPLRVLHALSLVYVVVAYAQAPVIRLIHRVEPDNVLCRLGRRSLLVFTFGAIFALPANEILNQANLAYGPGSWPAIGLELAFVAIGVAAMVVIADRRWRWPTALRWVSSPA